MNKHIYQPAPFFLVRSPYWAIEDCQLILKEKNWKEYLFKLYESDPTLQEAIAIASPNLYLALQKKSSELSKESAQSLMNYLMRMSTRATPFGLFSFVTIGSWKERAHLTFDLSKVTKRARYDSSWIYALIQNQYLDDKKFPLLPLKANSLIHFKNGRVLLSYVRYAEKEDIKNGQTFSIRSTKLVQEILSLAKNPITLDQLTSELNKTFTDLDIQKVKVVIKELFTQQFLIPSILPSLLNDSPFEDLMSQLKDVEGIDSIIKKMDSYNQTAIGDGIGRQETLKEEMKKLAKAKNFLQVDASYPTFSISLPHNVQEELAQVASFLWKCSYGKPATSPLNAYHSKFIERFGTYRLVPLLELLDEEKGLGNYQHQVSENKLEINLFVKQFEKWLFKEWQEAIFLGKDEIVINDQIIESLFELSNEKPNDPKLAAPSIDIFFKLIAESALEIEKGNFNLILSQLSWQGGATFGRFMDLFDDKTHFQMQSYIQNEEKLDPKVNFFELSYWPLSGHNANVSITPCYRYYRLDLERQSKNDQELNINDIYVGSLGNRFYLTTKNGTEEIVAKVGNMLNPSLSPLVLQFIRDVSTRKYHLACPFQWAALAESASFLPRVRFQKTILSEAQWNFDATIYSKKSSKEILDAFSSWANQWKLPNQFYLTKGDLHLFIDRHHPAHQQELISRIKKGGILQFSEKHDSFCVKSKRGSHLCEIVVPFLKNSSYTSSDSPKLQAYQEIAQNDRWKLQGSDWMYLKLYIQKDETDRFLVDHLSLIAESLLQAKAITGWFFVRYKDPQPHIRFRVKLSNLENFNQIVFYLRDVLKQWIDCGLIKEVMFAPYEREIERYGGPLLLEAAEAVFCADSLAAIHLTRHFLQKKKDPSEIVTKVLALITFLKGFGLTSEQIIELLDVDSKNKNDLKGYRDHKKVLIELTPLLEDNPLFTFAYSTCKEIQYAFFEKAQSFPKERLYRIFNDMLHMYCNRLGCDRKQEQQIRVYAHQTIVQLQHQVSNTQRISLSS